jgi:hypothetical protein
MIKSTIGILFILLCTMSVTAQLDVIVSAPKITAQKAIVKLTMKNGLAETVESARAICFLFDNQGKLVGESAKWVIGGTTNRPALEPKQEISFNFIITSPRPFETTNLTAKASFSRLILEGGKSVNPNKEVTIVRQSLSSDQISFTNNPVVSKPLDDVIASASERIIIKQQPPSQTAETIMVTNSLQPINPQQH